MLIQFMKMAEEENLLMKNRNKRGIKFWEKTGSETKQGFKTSLSSSENEKKSIDSVSINFLLEILVFNLSLYIDYRFFYEFIFHELII